MLFAIFAMGGFVPHNAVAKGQEKTAGSPKEGRWHGTIVRINTDQSWMDVRKGRIEKRIRFDSSTKWTAGTKPAEMSEFKEGSDVICLGTYDEKGVMTATRVDLRPAKYL